MTSVGFKSAAALAFKYSRTSIIRTPIIRISRLSELFLWSQFGYDYLLVTIKIRSHILFKTTALKGAVKCKGFLLSKSKGSARACRVVPTSPDNRGSTVIRITYPNFLHGSDFLK